ncbi:MAG: zinc ribbon domain-containing protein [Candidatus Acidiferrales bacterium]|jgi:hypothetical protein
MFCQYCGNALDDGARFCKSCGNPVSAPATAPQPVAPDPVEVLSKHVHILGILWLVYSIFHIVTAVAILAFSYYFLPTMQDAMSRSPTPFPFPIVQFLHLIYAISAVYGVAVGVLGIFAGEALLRRKPVGRALAVVAGFISAINIPLGTAIGVYTLIRLLPQDAARAYKRLARTS